MRNDYWILTLLLLFLCSCGLKNERSVKKSDYDYHVKVVAITDGDTFRGLTQDNREVRFRIHGIDAPERKQPFNQRSKQYLSDLIYDKTVGIVVQTEGDRYGRPVVWVYTPDGKDVSAEMIRAGMAWHYTYYSDDTEYARLEIKARKKRIGLWSQPNPVTPWDMRRSSR